MVWVARRVPPVWAVMLLSKNIHTNSDQVWRFVFILATGCAATNTPVSDGATGWSSDRAIEVDALIEGKVDAPCGVGEAERVAIVGSAWQARANALRDEGRPLFLDRARIEVDVAGPVQAVGGCSLPYRVHVESFGTHEEIEEAGGTPDGYAGVPFRRRDPLALMETPAYEAFRADGEVSFGAVFGQMDPDVASDVDEGTWSMHAFESYWAERGLPCTHRWGRAGVCKGRVGDQRIRVEYVGPDLFPVYGPAMEKRAWLRHLVQSSDVLYVNGHASQAGFSPLYDRAAFDDGRARLVVLDVCWSSLEMVPHMDRNLGSARVDVVSAPGRVVTGSVGSFGLLVDALIASSGERASWETLLWRMNEEAEARASVRKGTVEEKLEPAEIYGVSRLGR